MSGREDAGGRRRRLHRRFKLAIVGATALAIAGLFTVLPSGRFFVARSWRAAVTEATRPAEPRRETPGERAERLRLVRPANAAVIRESMRVALTEVDRPTRRLLEAAAMTPDTAVVRWGNVDQTIALSGRVFEADDRGRAYRFRPNTRSVWLRDVGFPGAMGFFQVPDTPEVRQWAAECKATIYEPSRQSTNSWGCRGPEPDPDADLRVLVLGDSFMQGMFLADDQTPPVRLEARLRAAVGPSTSVSVLNTGHLGYSPEQYYYTLLEYAPRFRPHIIVLSLYANDFGRNVFEGKADHVPEARFWIYRIHEECQRRKWPCLLVAAPHRKQLDNDRRTLFYPGPATVVAGFPGPWTLYPIDDFINADLRAREPRSREPSPLYNDTIHDEHFSAAGADLWAECVTLRLALLRLVPPAEGDRVRSP